MPKINSILGKSPNGCEATLCSKCCLKDYKKLRYRGYEHKTQWRSTRNATLNILLDACMSSMSKKFRHLIATQVHQNIDYRKLLKISTKKLHWSHKWQPSNYFKIQNWIFGWFFAQIYLCQTQWIKGNEENGKRIVTPQLTPHPNIHIWTKQFLHDNLVYVVEWNLHQKFWKVSMLSKSNWTSTISHLKRPSMSRIVEITMAFRRVCTGGLFSLTCFYLRKYQLLRIQFIMCFPLTRLYCNFILVIKLVNKFWKIRSFQSCKSTFLAVKENIIKHNNKKSKCIFNKEWSTR